VLKKNSAWTGGVSIDVNLFTEAPLASPEPTHGLHLDKNDETVAPLRRLPVRQQASRHSPFEVMEAEPSLRHMNRYLARRAFVATTSSLPRQ